MTSRILISESLENRKTEINKILQKEELSLKHPDLLYLENEEKLGVTAVKKIREFLSLKPYSAKGRVVVVESAHNLTLDAQNALLKTLEEPPETAIIVLGAESDVKILPTVLSRCEIVRLNTMEMDSGSSTSGMTTQDSTASLQNDIEKLQSQSIEERFEYIEKLEDKEEFLKDLIIYYRSRLKSHPGSETVEFLEKLMEAEQWSRSNVNIRAILEYLMLEMP